jgi:hypothetical protein
MAKKKATPPKPKRGRKPLPEAEKKSEPFQIKLSEEDRRLINAAAALDEHKPYPWARSMLVQAARLRLQEAGVPPVPPTRSGK